MKTTRNAISSCHEYLGCKVVTCPAYTREDDTPCWEVDDTLCNIPEVDSLIARTGSSKMKFCKVCLYYKYRMLSQPS